MITSLPNVYDTPLSFSPQVSVKGEGSDHKISQIIPFSGTSTGLIIFSIYDISIRSGDKPPCMHIILSPIIADIGK